MRDDPNRIVPGILYNEEEVDLKRNLLEWRERCPMLDTEIGSDWVTEPDLRQVSGEMA